MKNGHAAVVARGIRTLWASGAVGGMDDEQLIARFVERRDDSAEAAFEVLVERHGPMVLRVVRDILRDPHSAQDAFQATFLVLARKAGSIARPEALAPWLYGVAHRVARKARVEADRRRRHETRAAERTPMAVEPGTAEGEFGLGPTLHDEVARLPESCRVAVVLCYFEGLTYDQAAGSLGVTEATVRGRLARARQILRGRLSGWGAIAWSLPCVPGRWIGPTARAASRFAKGIKDGAPVPVAGLAEGVSRTMKISQLKTAAWLVAFHLLAVAGLLARQQPVIDGPETPRLGVTESSSRSQEPAKAVDEPSRLTLTLDQSIERLLREDHDLRSKFFEIPSAKADILTAGLRANPTFYADSQLVPYGQYNRERPGGQTPSDVNVSYPLDLMRKRATRTASAARTTKVIEAQYLDAARLRVDALTLAFGEALAARDLARLRSESVERLDRLSKLDRDPGEDPARARRIKATRSVSEMERDQAKESLGRRLRAVASFLNLPEGTELEVVGELGRGSGIPSTDSLVVSALATRPDLLAFRLGVQRAKADVKLAYANRLLVQPYIFDSAPTGSQGLTSWVLAFTSPMLNEIPRGDRDQAVIQRSKLNVTQSQVELSALERQIISEVGQAARECEASREAVSEVNRKATAVRVALDAAWDDYRDGTSDMSVLLAASRDADDNTKFRIEALARDYRARVALNLAVGRRVVQPCD